ncbi:hypothetical protein ARMGADRAFT_1033544 [Armillaria gallica]|uniref:Uncharacterized protein n=1 Tax=Armillaria gallica TaxID=47427 RepID=A0A2H3DL02_ARMGA|nr:hypothetical protein ARMGADRAFT_1033544 [Armillaria gallica]
MQSADKSKKAWFSLTKTKIKEHWDQESEAIKKMVHGKVKTIFQEAMMKYNSLWTELRNKTAADYHLIHSSTTSTSLKWPQFDPIGFSMVEKSMMQFGFKLFSEDEQFAKTLLGT